MRSMTPICLNSLGIFRSSLRAKEHPLRVPRSNGGLSRHSNPLKGFSKTLRLNQKMGCFQREKVWKSSGGMMLIDNAIQGSCCSKVSQGSNARSCAGGMRKTSHSLDYPSIPLVMPRLGVGTLKKYIQFPLVAI